MGAAARGEAAPRRACPLHTLPMPAVPPVRTRARSPARLRRDWAGLDVAAFRSAILGWYDARGRMLPFRGTRDPYAILVSETMAQQTQISRVGPAWTVFIARFPTFGALAAASPADVQRQWRGLGYNRRAVDLQRTARVVVAEMGGRLPGEIDELERLPGIGPYTARAVAAIAFDAQVGAVDTNVRRVLGRVVAGDDRALRPAELQAVADSLVPGGRAGDWTHALMDVGATFCRSRDPRCAGCPARAACAYASVATADAGAAEAGPGAAEAGPGGASRRLPFPTTTRWLRGRILDRVRAAEGDAWTAFAEGLGPHAAEDVVAMLAVLDHDGLIEVDPADPGLARLPVELAPVRAPSVGARRRERRAGTAP